MCATSCTDSLESYQKKGSWDSGFVQRRRLPLTSLALQAPLVSAKADMSHYAHLTLHTIYNWAIA